MKDDCDWRLSVVPPHELPLHRPNTLILTSQYIPLQLLHLQPHWLQVSATNAQCTSAWEAQRAAQCATSYLSPCQSLRDLLFTCTGLAASFCLPAELHPLLVAYITSNPSRHYIHYTHTAHDTAWSQVLQFSWMQSLISLTTELSHKLLMNKVWFLALSTVLHLRDLSDFASPSDHQ